MNPDRIIKRRGTVLDRLANKFTVGDGCWEWTAATDGRGYGFFWMHDRMERAHRVLYRLMVGPISADLQLDHLCLNKRCVRPDHLEAVTLGDNVRRHWALMTHCKRGHEFTPENIYRSPGRPSVRVCRACRKIHQVEFHQRIATA